MNGVRYVRDKRYKSFCFFGREGRDDVVGGALVLELGDLSFNF